MKQKIELGTWSNGESTRIDIVRLMVTRALIQANSGGGKSYGLRRFIEITAGVVQQIIIDLEGEFSSLREKHDFIIVAGTGGDALAHPKIARLLAIRLLETHASAVIDLSDVKSADRHLFVRLFIESLMEAPKHLRHDVIVVLDEAQIFCPEKGQGESEATNAVIDLATRGRKRGLCLVAATQRISMFHKGAAAELKNKLIGSTGLDVDVKRAAFDLGLAPKEALAILRPLDPGHFFAFGPAFGQKDPREMLVGPVLTSHPRPGQRRAITAPKPTEAIKALLPKLADLPKEAEEEARTVEDLRRENAQLKKDLKSAAKAAPAAPVTVLADKKKDAARDQQIKALQAMLNNATKLISNISAAEFFKTGSALDLSKIQTAMAGAFKEIERQFAAAFDTQRRGFEGWRKEGDRLLKAIEKMLADGTVPIDITVKHQSSIAVLPGSTRASVAPRNVVRAASAESNGTGNVAMSPGEAAILRACIQFPDGLRREQLTVLTGYKRSTRDAYIQRQREKGFVSVEGDRVIATDDGRAAMPDAEPLPTGVELQEYWLAKLPEGEGKILKILIDSHPNAVSRADLEAPTGFKRSTRDAYLQRMQAKQLVVEPSRGEVKAAEALFT